MTIIGRGTVPVGIRITIPISIIAPIIPGITVIPWIIKIGIVPKCVPVVCPDRPMPVRIMKTSIRSIIKVDIIERIKSPMIIIVGIK
jgi:hypothetical protein